MAWHSSMDFELAMCQTGSPKMLCARSVQADADVIEHIESFRARRVRSKEKLFGMVIKVALSTSIVIFGACLLIFFATEYEIITTSFSGPIVVVILVAFIPCLLVLGSFAITDDANTTKFNLVRPWVQPLCISSSLILSCIGMRAFGVGFVPAFLDGCFLSVISISRRLSGRMSSMVLYGALHCVALGYHFLEFMMHPEMTSLSVLHGTHTYNYYLLLGSTTFIGTVVITAWWRVQRFRCQRSAGEVGLSPKVAAVHYLFDMLAVFGVLSLEAGLYLHCDEGLLQSFRALYGDLDHRLFLLIAAALMTPSFFLATVGRDTAYLCLLRLFENSRAEKDSAFIAEMLTGRSVKVGMKWWVHHGGNDEKYPRFDPRRNWTACRIVEVSEDAFIAAPFVGGTVGHSESDFRSGRAGSQERVLTLAGHGTLHKIKMLDRMVPANELLAMAHQNMRCIDWTSLTLEIMSGAISSSEVLPNMYHLSRLVRPGERIDYFMSHSWHDNAELKWQTLSEIADAFFRKRSRYPTFWLDKVCIDQVNIADGLKVLPINVMACSKMLVLCGPTYPKRLWCAWELCTLFSFMSEANSFMRIKLVTLDDRDSTLLAGLAHFDVKHAHCYDPNEEHALLKMIAAVGTQRFNTMIRVCARTQAHGSLSAAAKATFSAKLPF